VFKRLAHTLTLMLVSLSFGQIDPKAEPFLDFIAAQEPTASIHIRTADYTLCSTAYGSGVRETCTRTVMDFVNRRLIVETHADGDDTLDKMVYADGQAATTDSFSEEPTVLPKDQVAILERSLDYAADVVQNGGALPDSVLSATYDGVVTYGGVVSGVQITASVMARSFMLRNVSP